MGNEVIAVDARNEPPQQVVMDMLFLTLCMQYLKVNRVSLERAASTRLDA